MALSAHSRELAGDLTAARKFELLQPTTLWIGEPVGDVVRVRGWWVYTTRELMDAWDRYPEEGIPGFSIREDIAATAKANPWIIREVTP